jgi:hypothetical protein
LPRERPQERGSICSSSIKTSALHKIQKTIIPCISMKERAFSKNEGLPSISSRASNIGLPMTKDFTALWSLPEKTLSN